jgi:hypothetical protein
MNNASEQMQVQFHNKANALFFTLYQSFHGATESIDRRTDENRFQQSKRNYVATMKTELELLAGNLLHANKEEMRSTDISRIFQQFIKDYLHRFVQKINAL